MANITFITGNQHKVDYLVKWLEMPVRHHKLDLDEVQSLDLRTVAEHKARQAFEVLRTPVLVEDGALTFTAMGRLPGPLIKWFLQELDVEGLCRLATAQAHTGAIAAICYAYFDGRQIHFFEHEVPGRVINKPVGNNGFGWNAIFIPAGSDKTYAQMTDEELRPFSMRALAIKKLQAFLTAK